MAIALGVALPLHESKAHMTATALTRRYEVQGKGDCYALVSESF